MYNWVVCNWVEYNWDVYICPSAPCHPAGPQTDTAGGSISDRDVVVIVIVIACSSTQLAVSLQVTPLQ